LGPGGKPSRSEVQGCVLLLSEGPIRRSFINTSPILTSQWIVRAYKINVTVAPINKNGQHILKNIYIYYRPTCQFPSRESQKSAQTYSFCCLNQFPLTQQYRYPVPSMEKTEDPSSGAMMPRQSRDEDGEKATPTSSTPDIMAASNEPSVETMDTVVPAEEEEEYFTGFKLLLTMFSLTLVGFLLMLDVSVVSTVSWHSFVFSTWGQYCSFADFCRPFQESPPTSIP